MIVFVLAAITLIAVSIFLVKPGDNDEINKTGATMFKRLGKKNKQTVIYFMEFLLKNGEEE